MQNYNVFLSGYSVGVDAYKEIPRVCSVYGKKAVVIGGHTAMEKAKNPLMEVLNHSEIEVTDFLWYGGNASYENAERLGTMKEVQAADMVFAVGGGRAIDTCKYMAYTLEKPLFTFPTIAATCAACTAVSAMYYSSGVFRDVFCYENPPVHTFINTQIIADAPKVYLWAGIGDTLAKHYECAFSARGRELEHYNALGLQISPMCVDPLVKYGSQALKDCENHHATEALEQVVLTNIITTGMVSTLVHNDYNSSVAHSVFYGLTTLKQIEEKHLHGEVVSYGVLVFLMMDQQYTELERIYQFNKSAGLPTCLADLDVTEAELDSVLAKASSVPDLDVAPYRVTAEMFHDAMMRLENYRTAPTEVAS